MEYLVYVAYFFGGAFFTNAIPHFVSGTMGHSFQSPFAKPPGEGQSSSVVNALWGSLNFAIAYLLIAHVGNFEIRDCYDVLAAGSGALAMSVVSAKLFGRFNGGNIPKA